MFRKAFLLAAGTGSRLGPLTDKIPKCLVPLGKTTLLDIWLDRLLQAGIREVLINTHHLAEEVESRLSRRAQRPAVRTVFEQKLLGSAGTVEVNRAFVKDEESFWVIYADNLTTISLRAMEEFHCHHRGVVTLAVYETDEPGRCGIVETKVNGEVVSFEEKPSNPRSSLANAGIYLCRSELFNYLHPGRADFGFDVLPRLIARMYAYPMTEYILDIGTPENYERACTDWPEMVDLFTIAQKTDR